jgi:hypothetical protein
MDPETRQLLHFKHPHKIRQLVLDNQCIPTIELLCLEPCSSSSNPTDTYAPLSRFINLNVLSLMDVKCKCLRGFPSLPSLRWVKYSL